MPTFKVSTIKMGRTENNMALAITYTVTGNYSYIQNMVILVYNDIINIALS